MILYLQFTTGPQNVQQKHPRPIGRGHLSVLQIVQDGGDVGA